MVNGVRLGILFVPLRRRVWMRAAIALFSAYTLVVQVLLANIIATQMAVTSPADPFAICYGTGGNPPGHDQPAGHVSHSHCVVCSFASFAPPLPHAIAVTAFVQSSVEPVFFAARMFAPARARHDPRTSQGPPQTA
jgi:hypothetical protein